MFAEDTASQTPISLCPLQPFVGRWPIVCQPHVVSVHAGINFLNRTDQCSAATD